MEALLEDKEKTRCIPFLGHLVAFAYAGHRVAVFEGHPSALSAGLAGSDVVIVDSAMLPFLQEDWAAVTFSVLAAGARAFVHERQSYTLMPVVKTSSPPDWRYTEPDGEASYANCLLTSMAKAKGDPCASSSVSCSPIWPGSPPIPASSSGWRTFRSSTISSAR